MGKPSIVEDEGGDGWRRAEQKGRVKQDMNSQRATLFEQVALALSIGGWGDEK